MNTRPLELLPTSLVLVFLLFAHDQSQAQQLSVANTDSKLTTTLLQFARARRRAIENLASDSIKPVAILDNNYPMRIIKSAAFRSERLQKRNACLSGIGGTNCADGNTGTERSDLVNEHLSVTAGRNP